MTENNLRQCLSIYRTDYLCWDKFEKLLENKAKSDSLSCII